MDSGINDLIRTVFEASIDEGDEKIDLYGDSITRPMKGFIGLSQKHIDAMKLVAESVSLQLKALNLAYDLNLDDENFKETPERIAKSIILEKMIGINSEDICMKILETSFPLKTNSGDMIIGANPALAYSTCPHHFESVRYKVYMGYIPGEVATGISKFNRVIMLWAKQPMLQEDYTTTLANIFHKGLKARGVMIRVYGQHNCMISRGVNADPNQWMVTSASTGPFSTTEICRNEFDRLCCIQGN